MGTYVPAAGAPNTSAATLISFIAGSAITERDLVEHGTTQGYVIPCDSANASGAVGVAQKTTASGAVCQVAMLGCGGVVEVAAEDGNIAVNGLLKSGTTTNDQVITAATSGTTAQHCVGTSLGVSETAGDVVLMALNINPVQNYFPALS